MHDHVGSRTIWSSNREYSFTGCCTAAKLIDLSVMQAPELPALPIGGNALTKPNLFCAQFTFFSFIQTNPNAANARAPAI